MGEPSDEELVAHALNSGWKVTMRDDEWQWRRRVGGVKGMFQTFATKRDANDPKRITIDSDLRRVLSADFTSSGGRAAP